MIKARDMGLNAITFTGGELALPRLLGGNFKDRNVVIFYDNDDAGKRGAKAVAEFMFEKRAKSVKVITEHYDFMEDKEDVFDYFTKYGKTRENFIEMVKRTQSVTAKEIKEISKRRFKEVSILQAKSGENRDKIIQSDVQVLSTYSTSYSIPKLMDLMILTPDK